MAANLSLNPLLVTNAPGTFSIQSEGYIQGVALDDPAVRYSMAGGVLALTETLPMWGGVGLTESLGYPPIQTSVAQDNLGSIVARAASSATVTAFSVFNQAHHFINTPQGDAPVAAAGMGVHFHRMGSGARIVVKADPALASLEGGLVGAQVSWDTSAQCLQPFQASAGTASITGITVSGGVATATLSGAISGWTLTAGDTVVISGATNSGTAPVALLNTSQKIVNVVSSTVFTFALPTNQGTWGTIGGTILLNYGGGALACKVIGLNIGNSKVVVYDAVNNYARWDNTGSTAVILI